MSSLCWRGSEHNFSVAKFHQRCNDKGASITIIKNTAHKVFGGYITKSWMSVGNFVDDKEAFLFTTERNGLKINVTTEGTNAFYDAAHYGPTFGSGFDLLLAD